MTNQEAIETLKANYPDARYEQLREAVDTAISALEKQDVPDTNVGDTVSKKVVELALLEKGQASKRYKVGEIWELNFDEIREALATVPPAQSKIIKCRNCKYYKLGSDNVRYCFNHDDDITWQDDDFCSRAERRADE